MVLLGKEHKSILGNSNSVSVGGLSDTDTNYYMMLWPILLVALLGLIAVLQSTEAKSMWGARRRKDDDANTDTINDGAFKYRKVAPEQKEQKQAPAKVTSQRAAASNPSKIVEQMTAKRMAKKQSSDIADNIQKTLDQIIEGIDSVVDMPNFDEIVNLDSMRQVLKMAPQLAEMPEVQAILDSDELKDPALLREKLLESFGTIKQYLLQMKDTLTTPEKVEELLDNLPPGLLQLMNAVKSGDYSGLTSLLDDVPGISENQKSIISRMLSGDADQEEVSDLLAGAEAESANMLNTVKEQLANPEMVALMKQQLLENPALLQMMGLSEDMLNDEEAFGEFLVQQMAQLQESFAADPEAVGRAMAETADKFASVGQRGESSTTKARRNARRNRAA